MYEIIPDLWICKRELLKNIDMNNIIHINCQNDLSFMYRYEKFNISMRGQILKTDIIRVYNYVKDKIDKINIELLNNQVIIVSCNECTSISPLIICCFLVKYGKLDIQESILALESKTGIIIKEDIFFSKKKKKIYNDSKK